jgi:hypothetical protein
MSKAQGILIIIEFSEELVGDVTTPSNAPAFTISWQEPSWIEKQTDILATLLNKSYSPTTVTVYNLEKKKLLLTMLNTNRFCNVYGDILVTYSSALGTLQGEGGVVTNFSQLFTPLDLLEELPERWYQNENILTSMTNYSIVITKVYYVYGYEAENILTSITNYSIVVTKVGSNPL